MAYFLGIDGGGSQTTCVVADERHMLGSGTAGGSNPVRFDDEQVREALHTAIKQACAEAQIHPSKINYACLGVAGTAREDTRLRIQRIVHELIAGNVSVVGDMVIAHESVFLGVPGAIVLAGTGSIAYGRNERGETARAGGWGSMISDEGSGYWIGRRAVSSVMQAVDGGESTALVTPILHEWHIASREELGRLCNSLPFPDFARLFPLVQQAADSGDRLAQQILYEAGEELAALVRVIVRRLWIGPRPIDIAISGGVFQNSSQVRTAFEQLVLADRPQASIRQAEVAPVVGAIHIARNLAEPGAVVTAPVHRHHN